MIWACRYHPLAAKQGTLPDQRRPTDGALIVRRGCKDSAAMLRFLWKCVLEVLPPTCATVVAGILLSAYHEHIVALQNVIDPRASLEQVAAPASEGSKQPQALTASEVRSERAGESAQSGDKSPLPEAHVNSPTPAPEGDRADGTASETRAPEGSDTKTAPPAVTDAQAAQLNAVLMASSPMSQPPAEIKAAQPLETKPPETTAAASEGTAAEGPSVVPGEPAQAIPGTDISPAAAKPAGAKLPDSQAASPVLRPPFSRHLAKPARKVTVVKMESERLPPPVSLVPLPPPAAPPIAAMESPPQVSPGRSPLPSHALPPPQAPAAPQAIGPTPPPPGTNPVVAGAAGPTGAPSSPAASGVNASQASQEGVAKTSEPTRVFGVPIPASIAAVGGALDPRPVLSAGQKAFEKIVTTAKSVVPDFGHEQQ
jgi:hypothetical protein